MDNIESLEIYDGKYKVIVNNDEHTFKALRYGEEWRNLTGDNLVRAMFSEIQELQIENKKLKKGVVKMKKFFIPVIWQETGTMEIEANSLEEAIELALGDHPLPKDESDYLDDSCVIDEDSDKFGTFEEI